MIDLDLARRETVALELKAQLDKKLRAEPEVALGLSEVLLDLVNGIDHLDAIAQRGRAACLHILGKTSDALPHYERAAAGYRQAGDSIEEGKVLRSLVDVYQMLGRTEDAMASAESARTIFEEKGEARLLAQLEVNLGNVWFRLDDYGAARDAYHRGRALFESLDDELGLAFVDYNLAGIETHAQEFDRAEQAFESARQSLMRAGMHVHVADCEYGLAYLLARRGEFARAIEDLEAARERYADSTKPSGVPLCDKDLAETYLRLGVWKDAVDHAERAVRSFSDLGMAYERAQAEVLRAQAWFRLGRREQALGGLESAEQEFRRLDNDVQSAFVRVQRATWLIEGDPVQARDILRAACAALEATEHKLLKSIATLSLAQALLATNESEEALELLERMRPAAGDESSFDDLLAGQAGQCIATAHERLGDWQRARDELRRTIDRIDQAYLRTPGRDARISFLGERSAAFFTLARIGFEEGSPEALEESLVVIERSRHRSLSEAPRGDAPKSKQWRKARARVDSLLARRLDSELGRLAGAEAPAPTTSDLDEACAELARLRGRDRSTRAVAPASRLDEIRAALGAGESLISYLPIRDGFGAILISKDELRAIKLDAPRDTIQRLASRVTSQMHKSALGAEYLERRRGQLLRNVQRVMDELGARLLEPVLPQCAGRTLLISGFGELHELPFHAMRCHGAALVDSYDVSTTPSTTLLTRARRPAGGDQIALVRASSEDLPAVERELASVEAHFEGATRRLADARTAENLERGLRAAALHVSGHGSFLNQQPLFSGMQLEGSFLTVLDLQSMDLELDLVTFSGCDTGRVAEVGGEDYYGLKHALLGAGVRTVVGSQWPVLDEDCARFMDLYYARLAEGADVRGAVCDAQRAMSKDQPHPMHWAAFSMSGDPSTKLAGGRSAS
ncbi:MAG: CHAT domain-containing protein/predicted Zn-dependent protease [Planctomycetota bacterium]